MAHARLYSPAQSGFLTNDKLIVDSCVSLKDRQATKGLREHRQVIRKKLRDINGMDVGI